MSKSYDLVIVGGGIAGSALSIVMARAGKSVLLLEQSETYEDKVRGEWIAPWGVKEVRALGLYDLLCAAGGHHLASHITYDETITPDQAEAKTVPLSMFVEGVPGPLCIGHPHHCQTLFDEAGRAGATTLRGVLVSSVKAGANPQVTYRHNDVDHTVNARLIVGADGRASQVREAIGVTLHQDPPHHMFAGMLVEDAHGWSENVQAIGTEDDFGFLAFPQGAGKVRLYGSYALDQRRRFAGPDGPKAFLDAFRVGCSPSNRHLADAKPAGPLLSYFNNDAWTDEPFAQGAVLIGDSAGWNDPIIGLGLSITYRDTRIVRDILLASDDWSPAAFAPYAAERAERMRRLRFTAKLQSALDAEFGDTPRERRRSYFERSAADPSIGAHAVAVMAGPEVLPPEMFTEAHRERVLGA